MDRLLNVLGVLFLANFATFFVVALYLGGDALNGYAENGHYFLRLHHQITEVSQPVFEYSWWHAVSLFIMIGLVYAAAAVRWVAKAFRSDPTT
jgi:hypothetical protein